MANAKAYYMSQNENILSLEVEIVNIAEKYI